MINKVDRVILELQMDAEDIYNQFVKVIDNVNVIISTYQTEDMGDISVKAEEGSVAFGSGKDQWAFSTTKFARFYASKFNMDSTKSIKL